MTDFIKSVTVIHVRPQLKFVIFLNLIWRIAIESKNCLSIFTLHYNLDNKTANINSKNCSSVDQSC